MFDSFANCNLFINYLYLTFCNRKTYLNNLQISSVQKFITPLKNKKNICKIRLLLETLKLKDVVDGGKNTPGIRLLIKLLYVCCKEPVFAPVTMTVFPSILLVLLHIFIVFWYHTFSTKIATVITTSKIVKRP